MTDNNHPITPPPELVRQWARYQGFETPEVLWRTIATQAARWGADVELEACKEWVANTCPLGTAKNLHDARRPKPPSLKEQALETLKYPKDLWSESEVDTIRRALEQLDD